MLYRFTERDARTITNQKKKPCPCTSRVKEHGTMEAPRLALFDIFFCCTSRPCQRDTDSSVFSFSGRLFVKVHFQGVQVAMVGSVEHGRVASVFEIMVLPGRA